MEKEETLNKEDQNLKDEKSDLIKINRPQMRLEKKKKKNNFHLRMKLQTLKIKLLEHLQKWKIKEEGMKRR